MKQSGGLLLTREKYASEIPQRAGMQNYKAVQTVLATSGRLSINNGEPLTDEESTKYHMQPGRGSSIFDIDPGYLFCSEQNMSVFSCTYSASYVTNKMNTKVSTGHPRN
jgi:hypothetical protein